MIRHHDPTERGFPVVEGEHWHEMGLATQPKADDQGQDTEPTTAS